MSVRLVHPPRASAGDSVPPDHYPAAANDDHADMPGLWFPSTRAHDLFICAGIVLLIAFGAVLLFSGSEPLNQWGALLGFGK
ncbi:hypothetical protein APR50_32645 [Variovorax paradoxus]|jgi:hypothetical protein|uniref:hypothetical protein n=1 Tax=Variovorax paradoxus TaxID=34073 RepID=UPI0006E5EB64|nr:hypothetical protein APR52_13950 [Variovorax paradoxus]KPV00470.1 hypothetical protein APR50_32645 [Variovorax paradoxus]KPV08073.1 hypothetical protein APR49_16020 [Variovorax paradoxus]KPV22536.1 hypothetical protein APR51_10015 [Variovorax paradoxus]KPV35393.1 hypothetical protein APR48_04435 [Variovorax paradoxus]